MLLPKLVQEVVDALETLPQVEAVLLSGSRGQGPHVSQADQNSDFNLTVFLTASLDESVRRTLLSARAQRTELDNFDRELSDDALLNDGSVLQIFYRRLEDSEKEIAQVSESFTAKVGFTTCLWAKLLSSRILFDRQARVLGLQKKFVKPYPDGLVEAIVKKNWPLLSEASPSCLNRAKKALVRGDWPSVQSGITHFLDSYFDLLFAVNKILHPGNKKLISFALGHCTLLPAGFERDMEALRRSLGDSEAWVPSRLEALSLSLGKLLVQQGLLEASVLPPDLETVPKPVSDVKESLKVYTDGGCIGNPGKGGWAFLIRWANQLKESSGGEKMTTNNQMELSAVIQALLAIRKNRDWDGWGIEIHTDSQYVKNGITTWIKSWEANGWKTSAKEPVKNQEFWKELRELDQALKPRWIWVKGHAGNPDNERCDRLVRAAMDAL